MRSSLLAGAVALASSVSAAVDPIVINGKHFFYKTNQTEFFIRGVAYQQDYTGNNTLTNTSYIDPLSNGDICKRDIPYLVALRTNVIRTYQIDPTLNHDDCMNAFAAAGIYVLSDLGNPYMAINRDAPSWTTDLYSSYTAVIQNLGQYTNTIGFFAGNEVTNEPNNTAASAFVKAAVRDLKAYVATNMDRPMYVGYASYEGPVSPQMIDYFNCGDQDSAIDFWGYNVYSWCGSSSYTASGYDDLIATFSTYSVPAFFAEYGCNSEGAKIITRNFQEVGTIFGSQMTPVWSGGIVYQYFQTANLYGLVNISADGNTVTPNQDYDNLSSQMAKISPSSTAFSAVSTGTPTTCPSVDANWEAYATPLPPTPNAGLCECMTGSLSCITSPGTDNSTYGDTFGYVCGLQNGAYCAGIQANASTGTYGAYGMCQDVQKLDFVLNQYYQAQSSSNPSACVFSGQATTTSPSSATGSCSSLLNAAGSQGTIAVTGVPVSATGSTSKSEASLPKGHAVIGSNILYLGLFVFGAVASGAGALVL